MKLEVFKSDYTGEFFEKEEDYLKHCEEHSKIEEEKKQVRDISKKLQEVRLTATSLEEFRENFVKLKKKSYPNLYDIIFSHVYFGDISNTHSAPINGVSNFSSHPDKPTSYKGWGGSITIIYKKEPNTFGSDVIDYNTGINTGSGGYRGKEYGDFFKNCYVCEYGLRMYLDDFPLIKEKYENYKKLEDLYNAYLEELDKKQYEVINKDRTIKDLKQQQKDKEVELNNIKSDLMGISNKIYNKTQDIKQKVSDKFTFEFQKELEESENWF